MNKPDTMLDGDRGFTGWNAALSPDNLPSGKLALSVNNRMRSGEVEPRKGIRKTGWWNPEGYPFHNYVAGTWTGNLVIGTGSTESAIWTDPDTGITHTSGTRRVGWTVERVSGPGFSTTLVGDYIKWDSGLIQIVRSRPDADTLVVDDYAGFDLTVSAGDPFGYAPLAIEPGTWTGFSSATIIRAGFFSDPNGLDWDVRITDSLVWFSREGYTPWSIAIEDGGVMQGDDVYLLQCFERLLLFRGETKNVLEWDGSAGGSFLVVPDPDGSDPDYTQRIPGAKRALFFANRVWVGFARDTIAVSDVATYTRYDYLANEFRLNDGSSDQFVTLHPFGKRAILVFFERSIYLLENVFGDLSELTARRISTSVGCGGADTVCDVADDVVWCDKDGQVWKLSQVDDDRMELVGRPLSWSIQPDIRSQDTGRVDLWRAAYFDGYYHLATTTPDADGGPVYIYDTTLGDWVSRDQLEPSNLTTSYGPQCLGFIKMEAYGEQRLLYQAAHHSCIYGYGQCDNTAGYEWSVNQVIRTRAVTTLPLQDKRTLGVAFSMKSLNPTLDVAILGQGHNQEQALFTDKTFDRTKYTAWNKDAFVTDNSNNDYNTPHRQDYFVYIDDGLIIPATQEIIVNPKQEWRITQPVRALVESIQLELTNGTHPPDDEIFSYPSTFNMATGITLGTWRIENRVVGRQLVSLT